MRIFVDMDEVLADTYGAHIDLYNEKYRTQLTKEACKGGDVWEFVPKEHQDYIHEQNRQRGFFSNLKVMEDSQDVLEQLSKDHEVYIASAAMQFPQSLEEKSIWLDNHFPFITWEYRILCGHKFVLKGDVLIDDRSFNLDTFEGRAIQFTSPHNINSHGYERVETWKEIGEKLL
ncbi:5' nucleotidase, NT5C type [Flavimarina sp. Hel_I_48]|uniref:5' nucleotidase, NT5C type n=1 Tax=Flavimarina sp. Hel_I_48 TaxID=1392488 RepID=UPI0004DEECE2|nr:5'-3'-deoxyribonucleotidase [Flavimarina sp. Hel_I_48]